jgi:hypothetical protein
MSPTAVRQNELLDQLAVDDATAARGFARRIRALAELGQLADDEERDGGLEQFTGIELAGTRRQSRMAAENDLVDARRYVEALPLTVELLSQGLLLEHQARTILRATVNCSTDVARRAEQSVIADGGASLAPPDLRRALTKAILTIESDLDSDAVTERLMQARARRRTWARNEDDGMASIGALGPAEQVRRWVRDMELLVLQEKVLDRAAGVWRSADQIRADLVLAMPGLLLAARAGEGGANPTRPRQDTMVNVFVPVVTVLEHSSDPGDLEGYGPISAEHVRLLMPQARLRRGCVDHDTGRLLSLDDEIEEPTDDTQVARERLVAMLRPSVVRHRAEPQHDPSMSLRRFVEVRSPRCDGPGCSVPSHRSHKDHRIPYPAGPTAEGNLDPRSASCHRAKHSGWEVRIEPDGSTTWTSPLGRSYRRRPPYDPPTLPPAVWQLSPPRRIPAEPIPEADADRPMSLPDSPSPEPPEPNRGWGDTCPF